MQTKVFKIDVSRPDPKIIDKAVDVLKAGGIIIYPTETCYGIGADVLNEQAVRQIFQIKKRPLNNPLIAIVPDVKTAEKYCHLTGNDKRIVKKIMPGPLTLVAKKKKAVPDVFDRKEFAFRIPGDKVSFMLVKKFGNAITATSANISDTPSIYSSRHAIDVFDGLVNLILDGGPLPVRPVTTIADIYKGVHIRRFGPVSVEQIKKVLR